MNNVTPKWSIAVKSETCEINNLYGQFKLVGYELTNQFNDSITVTVVHTADVKNDATLRLNSACITSEVFGDNSCDCAWQLSETFRIIADQKNGIIIYTTFEEGRGIGLIGKANTLAFAQKYGNTSSESFRALGYDMDSRNFSYAPVILHDLGVTTVRFLTNNPKKISALKDGGIFISAICPLVAYHREDLEGFYQDKSRLQGHQIAWKANSKPEGNSDGH